MSKTWRHGHDTGRKFKRARGARHFRPRASCAKPAITDEQLSTRLEQAASTASLTHFRHD